MLRNGVMWYANGVLRDTTMRHVQHDMTRCKEVEHDFAEVHYKEQLWDLLNMAAVSMFHSGGT